MKHNLKVKAIINNIKASASVLGSKELLQAVHGLFMLYHRAVWEEEEEDIPK